MNLTYRWNHEADSEAGRISTTRTIEFEASNEHVFLNATVMVPAVPQAPLSGAFINAESELREFVGEMLEALGKADYSEMK